MPTLADKIRSMADTLANEGIYIRVVQGLRTIEQQEALYAQGRTAPGSIVTNCRGGQSYHNYGLAVDCVPSSQGTHAPFAPDWNPTHSDWKRMISVGTSLGLDSGSTWRTFKDFPHFQLTGEFPEGEPTQEVYELYAQGSFQAVWDVVTKTEVG
jgi:peptidoglycan L-alanyl-D-glutamate endopeptidase CwlK